MKRSKIAGIAGTIIVHAVLILLLFLCTLSRPEKEEEGGVPVMLGHTEQAGGEADPYTLTEVDVTPAPEADVPATEQAETEQPLITQTDEPSLQVKEEHPKQEKPKPEKSQPKKQKEPTPKPKEKTEAEKRAEAEQAAAKAAASKIAGAFGKGAQMGSKGNATGQGVQGAPTGNGSDGKTSGIGGTGTFDLNGRSLGPGGLPVPDYKGNDEGRVVVTIIVNPAGKVVSTSINKRTNTVNPALRRAAEEAARRATFNEVDGVNNQSGTITYYFKLK